MSSDNPYADYYKRIELGSRTVMTVRASSPDWFALWIEARGGGGQHMTTIYLRRRQLRELASALRWMDAVMPVPEPQPETMSHD